ncbi:MAG: sigma-70 family RNA polymerase sigma factor [Xanthomonadales bacterium]|nr:sigma-70 family RNA polymerase sigma factor [Xanthomonadales bacterium]
MVPEEPIDAAQDGAQAVGDITRMLGEARDGDRAATSALFSALYGELKRLARGQLHGPAPPMQATSLVHEAWCKLATGAAVDACDREHFYAVAARVMRQVVIDHVRARAALRRGGDLVIGSLDTQALRMAASPESDLELLALDEALVRLAEVDRDLARLVEMRFFAGLELTEISALTGRSERSLKRDWRRARAFLHAQVEDGGPTAC